MVSIIGSQPAQKKGHRIFRCPSFQGGFFGQPVLEPFLLHFKIGAALDAPFLFKFKQSTRLQPVILHAGHEAAKDAVLFAQWHSQRPWVVVFGVQRHFIVGVFARGQVGGNRAVVIDPSDAFLVAQRLFGFGVAGEGNDLGAVPLFNDFVIERALFAADGFVRQLVPAGKSERFRCHDVGARRVVIRLYHAHEFASVRPV